MCERACTMCFRCLPFTLFLSPCHSLSLLLFLFLSLPPLFSLYSISCVCCGGRTRDRMANGNSFACLHACVSAVDDNTDARCVMHAIYAYKFSNANNITRLATRSNSNAHLKCLHSSSQECKICPDMWMRRHKHINVPNLPCLSSAPPTSRVHASFNACICSMHSQRAK